MSNELRERKLNPGAGLPPEEVERSQRERLYGAMVATVAAKGYEETSVADLLALSGVSRRTFYLLFADKRACFIATIEALIAAGIGAASAEFESGGDWRRRVLDSTRTLLGVLAAQPAAARLCVVEAYAAGPEALAPMQGAVDAVAELGARMIASGPIGGEVPTSLVRAMAGGLHRVMYQHLVSSREAELPALAEEAIAWALGYLPLDGPLRGRKRPSVAPGSAPPFAAHIPSERILRGYASAVAAKGYAQTTIAEISSRAQISQETFYSHFGSKADALEAALESSGAQMVAAALPNVRRRQDWLEGVQAAIEAMFGFLAAEPAFARLRAIEAYAAGPRAIELRDSATIELLEVAFAMSDRELPRDSFVWEATIGALNAVVYDAVTQGRIGEAVPLGSYVVLAPMVGAERAYAVCCQ